MFDKKGDMSRYRFGTFGFSTPLTEWSLHDGLPKKPLGHGKRVKWHSLKREAMPNIRFYLFQAERQARKALRAD